ncbi:Ima1 N-terminal domain-containing protein [Aspergillus cavernicola]|uniref:Ima1 N-terminal domain-containing protein n=1 Tax=Aspergillus cavernicola TaxID=176166 RepID=A0ABR4ILS7_9EURO
MMAPLFSKRLSCFYCGRRSPQSNKSPVRKWQCKHCEAVNYLDENGEITDPPAAETNPHAQTPGPSNPPFESLTGSDLFCAQCVRNQHLFTSALASYFPSSDDPNYSAYEREYPKFRNNMEERYPQVCDKCEPRVKARIRQTGYEAKSDHLRRVMDKSKAGKAARRARRWNWRSLLVLVGALCYWTSILGQLAWDLASALIVEVPLQNPEDLPPSPFVTSCFQQTFQTRRIPSYCLVDLVPYAGLALVAGILSLWWNPKLRLKVEGRGGRFLGLGEYYKVQLIVMVVRCAFWAVFRDPSSSGLDATLLPALHSFMILFTLLSIIITRRVVRYDTRPLVNWAEATPTATPSRKTQTSPQPTTGGKQPFFTPHESTQPVTPRFPFEKLATPRTAQQERAIPTPPPEVDDMDWTPSIQHNFRPVSTIHQRDQPSVLDGPTPFYGQLPPAPKPPSWNLRNQSSQLQKPINQVIERNPFHRSPAQPSATWGRNTSSSDPAFAPPRFFPEDDHTSTGLENLFDQTFNIKSPEDDEDTWHSPRHATTSPRSSQSESLQGLFISQCVRLGLLLVSLIAWNLSQHALVSIPGDYIEVASLGIASLLAGFAILESVKQPILQWNGMELLVYFAELAAAVHLGGYLPGTSIERHYFDRYGKLLLVFMAVQEALGLQAVYRGASLTPNPGSSQEHQPHRSSSPNSTIINDSPRSRASIFQPFTSPLSATAPPQLSFSSTAPSSSFMPQQPGPQYQLPFPSSDGTIHNNKRDHSFSLKSLKYQDVNASDLDLDRDSDTETSMTTATTATNNTVRNIRYGRNNSVNDVFFSPKRSELGPGIGGLSLDDEPGSSKRMTRSQSQRLHNQHLTDGIRRRGLR